MGLFSKKQESDISEALNAGKAAFIAEREAAEKRLEAEASVREAFGDQKGADSIREYVKGGREITDRYRHR